MYLFLPFVLTSCALVSRILDLYWFYVHFFQLLRRCWELPRAHLGTLRECLQDCCWDWYGSWISFSLASNNGRHAELLALLSSSFRFSLERITPSKRHCLMCARQRDRIYMWAQRCTIGVCHSPQRSIDLWLSEADYWTFLLLPFTLRTPSFPTQITITNQYWLILLLLAIPGFTLRNTLPSARLGSESRRRRTFASTCSRRRSTGSAIKRDCSGSNRRHGRNVPPFSTIGWGW